MSGIAPPFTLPHSALVDIYHIPVSPIFSSVAMSAVTTTFDSSRDLRIV